MEGYAGKPYDWIYLLEVLGERVAVDTRQSARLPISDACWTFLASTRQSDNTSQRGQNHSQIFPPGNVRQELEVFENDFLPRSPASDEPPPLQTITLNIAHACNLSCAYCFENWPTLKKGFKRGQGLMSEATALQAIDFMIQEAGGEEVLILAFFGGEPLLNWPVMQKAVRYAEQRVRQCNRQIEFNLTTNGTLLTRDVQDFIVKHRVRVILSMDGSPEAHDRFRVFKNGKGSSHLVLRRAIELRKRMEQVGYPAARDLTIRGTFLRPTIDFESSVYHLVKQGFYHISVENGVIREDIPFSLRMEDVAEVKSRYDHFVQRMADDLISGKNRFRFFHMAIALECIGNRVNRKRQCGAGAGYIAVSSEGDLYPCHQLVGLEEVKMGNIRDGWDREKGLELWNTNTDCKPACKQCWARSMCGGGCHANAHLINGRFDEPDPVSCELFRYRAKLGFYLMQRLKQEAPHVLEELVSDWLSDRMKPRRKEEIRMTPHGDGLVLFHPTNRKIYHLDRVSSFVWERCNNKHNICDIADEMETALGVPRGSKRPDVRNAVMDFRKKELLIKPGCKIESSDEPGLAVNEQVSL